MANKTQVSVVKELTKIVVDNKLEFLKCGEIEIRKIIHAPDLLAPLPKMDPKEQELLDEALLFQSGV